MRHTLDLYFIQMSHFISEQLSNQAQTRGSLLQPVIFRAINKKLKKRSHIWIISQLASAHERRVFFDQPQSNIQIAHETKL